MTRRWQRWKLIGLGSVLSLAFGYLGYLLADLQVVHHEEYLAKAERLTRQEVVLEPRRGDILDSQGNLLATSEPRQTVCANPAWLGSNGSNHQAEVARLLAPLLEQSETNLLQRLLPRVHRNARGRLVTNDCVELKHKVTLEAWDRLQQAITNFTASQRTANLSRAQRSFYHNLLGEGLFARHDPRRVYPSQTLAAHVLGYATSEPGEAAGQPVQNIVGQDGIEKEFDLQLAGVRGWRLTEANSQRKEQVHWRDLDVEPRDGLNVVLTIDAFIQQIVETALADAMAKHRPISVSGIVVRPRTGEILAMATLPTYNPNDPGAAPPDARRNRAIADVFEPGSVFKVVVVSGALDQGLVSLTEPFFCENGVFHYAGHALHDHGSFGRLTVEQIITKSSNIGAAKIALRLGGNLLHDYILGFGFGAPSGLPLPGEVNTRRFVHPVKEWSKVSIAQLPMGQGISVTRLQMTMALSAIANHGLLVRPMLVDRLEDRHRNVAVKYSPQAVRQVISPAAAKLMVQALKTVVSPDGTAPGAALEHYTTAGKTGTAQKPEHGGYAHDKFFSSFIGFFPADQPELCIGVMMDEPKEGHYGGQAAAPVFKEIAERTAKYLCIPPDRPSAAPLLAELPAPAASHDAKPPAGPEPNTVSR
jgi:cell division protein FtsI/penicillin-binding protein 2